MALCFVAAARAGEPGGASPALAELQQLEQGFRSVAERVAPSVVAIRVQRGAPAARFAEASERGPLDAVIVVNGSGVILRADGAILTNEHVIAGAQRIDVFLHTGQSRPARLVASDARADLAVLKIDQSGLRPIELCEWAGVARGQWTVALGNPFGLGNDGRLSMTVGVISNLGRRLPGLGEADDRLYADMIQTTAAINPGNSGGPLLGLDGKLIGVITAMHTRSVGGEGVGFAIPLTPARRHIIERLLEGQPIVYGYLGLKVRALGDAPTRGARGEGVVVESVEPRGPAAAAGLHEGDVITRVDQTAVGSPAQLLDLICERQPGQRLALGVRRGEQTLVAETALAQREPQRVHWMRGGAVVWRGIRVGEVAPDAAQRAGQSGQGGLIVLDIAEDSPARAAALGIGDVIERVENEPVADVEAFNRRVERRQGAVQFLVRQRGIVVVEP